MITNKKILLIILALFTFTTVVSCNELKDKGYLLKNELHLSYLNVDRNYGNIATEDILLYSRYKKNVDGGMISLTTEIMYLNYDYKSDLDTSLNEKDSITLIIIDEMYYKYIINDNLSFIAGKIDFRTDNGSVVTLPQDRKNNINPLMSNYIADGAYLNYHVGNHVMNIGYLSKDVFFNSILINEDQMYAPTYKEVGGLSLMYSFKGSKNNLSFNYFKINGKACEKLGGDINADIFGYTYILDDSMDSGYTFFNYGAYSHSENLGNTLTGYSFVLGFNKYITVPYINRDATIGFEHSLIKDDYVSLNTGRFLSTYSMFKNGKQNTVYIDLEATNKMHAKFRLSRYEPDGYNVIQNGGFKRYDVDSRKPQHDIRFEIEYDF